MDTSDTPLKILINHFDANGWPLHINLHKLLSRYSLTHDDNLPDCNIAEIERHRPILSACYVPGLPMAAFETYYMRYAVRVCTLEVAELPERQEKIDIDIDDLVSSDLDREMFSLSIEAIDKHSYEIKEDVSKEKQIISNLHEAKEFCGLFLESFVDYFSDSLHRELTEHQFDKAQIKQLLSDYEKRMSESLLEKAVDVWQSRDAWE